MWRTLVEVGYPLTVALKVCDIQFFVVLLCLSVENICMAGRQARETDCQHHYPEDVVVRVLRIVFYWFARSIFANFVCLCRTAETWKPTVRGCGSETRLKRPQTAVMLSRRTGVLWTSSTLSPSPHTAVTETPSTHAPLCQKPFGSWPFWQGRPRSREVSSTTCQLHDLVGITRLQLRLPYL